MEVSRNIGITEMSQLSLVLEKVESLSPLKEQSLSPSKKDTNPFRTSLKEDDKSSAT